MEQSGAACGDPNGACCQCAMSLHVHSGVYSTGPAIERLAFALVCANNPQPTTNNPPLTLSPIRAIRAIRGCIRRSPPQRPVTPRTLRRSALHAVDACHRADAEQAQARAAAAAKATRLHWLHATGVASAVSPPHRSQRHGTMPVMPILLLRPRPERAVLCSARAHPIYRIAHSTVSHVT